ncbi:MAG TPA: hypothetical protein VGI40_25055 [Pirellulaceae bacterium]|jgi:Tfp pilus assembly protein PilX
MNPRHPHKCRQRHRQGAILIVALVCLAIVMALIGGMLLCALRSTRQLRSERDLRQCELLLAAGIARATHQFATASDYRGETWQLPAEQVSNNAAGEVTIRLNPDAASNQPQIEVIAEYPAGSETSVRRSQTIPVPITRPARQE